MKPSVLILILLLSGCSLVQWLPSSSCEYVKYERIKSDVYVEALCRV